MNLFTLIAILLTVTAAFAYVNYRTFKLPTAVGLMLTALIFSGLIMLIGHSIPGLRTWAGDLVSKIDFSRVVLQGLLSFILFAGALNVSTLDLKKEKLKVTVLATVGVVISTVLIGFAVHGIMLFGGLELSLMYCFVFGALISPTDPVAVLSTLRSAKLPKQIETRIAGESLFNDGMGLVIFFTFLALATTHEHPSSVNIAILMTRQIVGGIFLGVAFGWVTAWFMKRTTDSRVLVLITLACANGGYALATYLETSAPIAVVVAGLWLGSQKALVFKHGDERNPVDIFWEIIDEILNAILFVFIGLYLLALPLEPHELFAGLLAIPVVLIARFISVGSIMTAFKLGSHRGPMAIGLMTWGGIRGGVSIALALSLTTEPAREIIVSMTYVIVAFSILVQGLTIKKFIKNF